MASGGDTSFTLAVATEGGAAEQLNQIIAAWVGTADRGVPLEMVEVEHATKYALDVRNKETTSSLVARFRNAAGEVLLSLVKEAVTIGKPTTFTGAVTFSDDVTFQAGQSITADLVGDVTGDLTGDVTGNVTGNVTGDLTGDVTGNLTGNVTGDVTGNADTATTAGTASTATGIADGAVSTTAKMANDIVDDTKVGNRVPQFYRRQGGSATDWSASGASAYAPTSVRMQAGSRDLSITSGNYVAYATITFPVAFSQVPLVFASIMFCGLSSGNVACAFANPISATQFTLYVRSSVSDAETYSLSWLAIGPE